MLEINDLKASIGGKICYECIKNQRFRPIENA